MTKRALGLLFPIYLLAVQYAALSHAVAHAIPTGSAKEQAASFDHCTQCASFAKVAHAAVAEATFSPALLHTANGPAASSQTPTPSAVDESRSRGPPEVI
jgi:hypothetical protein